MENRSAKKLTLHFKMLLNAKIVKARMPSAVEKAPGIAYSPIGQGIVGDFESPQDRL